MENLTNLLSTYSFAIFPLFLFFFFLFKRFFADQSTTKNIPSPAKLPIIGNLHQLDKHPHRSLHNLSKQHGELMLLHLGKKPVLVVSSAKTALQVMKTHDFIFSDRPVSSICQKLSYNRKNIARAPYGEYWRQNRSVCVLQLLSNKRVQSFQHVREEEIAEMIQEIERSPTEEVNLSKLFVTLTNNLICRAAFGMKFDGERVENSFKELMKKHEVLGGAFYVGDFIPWLAWIHRWTGAESEIEENAKKMDRCLEGIIEEHLEYEREKDESLKDFVDVLLELQDFNKDRDSIKAIIQDMFIAGTTTTFATLEWIISEVIRNPRIKDILTNEVRGIVGGKPGITDDDLEKMKYMKAVIKETFRLHPPVPLLLPRRSMKDAKINSYDIAAGTQVIVNAWTIHRDPEFWEDPEDFCPERFFNSPIDFKGQDFNLIPFGSGRRGCPGITFATTNIELAVANLFYRFNWTLPEGKDLDMTEGTGITVHRKIPLRVLATPHSCQLRETTATITG